MNGLKITQEEVEKYVKNFNKNDELVYVNLYKVFGDLRSYWITIWRTKNNYYVPDIFCFLEKQFVKRFSMMPFSGENNINLLKENENFLKQIGQFQLINRYAYCYDFNHDGIDEIISFDRDMKILFFITSINPITLEFRFLLDESSYEAYELEFIIYKGKQGIKLLRGGEWRFYFYNHNSREYQRDEQVLSDELSQIHGNSDFFAEAGIDYTKLERPLLPVDLENFSKAALRIWRNAIYARHGRIFKSEDLQALFNEYAWYKQDEDYSDDKLSDIDNANIRLIKEFEEK